MGASSSGGSRKGGPRRLGLRSKACRASMALANKAKETSMRSPTGMRVGSGRTATAVV